MKIDARGVHYKDLNDTINEAVAQGEKTIAIDNVNGQRYIAAGLKAKVNITLNGVPGNDLGIFMDGPKIEVNSNTQDGTGNTMNSGEIIVHGSSGDITGYAMRGGAIYVRDNVGYRVGIHMKSYKENIPVIVVGKSAGDFLGEYMAGGVIIILDLDKRGSAEALGEFVGTGMHGGAIYTQGEVPEYKLGKEVGIEKPSKTDAELLKRHIRKFCKYFGHSKRIPISRFCKLYPKSLRPYGTLYAY